MLNVIILGSTGSLGIQTLEVLKKYKKNFRIIGLSANTSEKLLCRQAKEFKVGNVALASRDGEKAVLKLSRLQKADIIVNVLSGISGISPSISALKSGKILILGNKESLVAEGKKIMRMAKLGKNLIPLDSEHNAIFEILRKYPDKEIKKIIIPCSGGPFYKKTTHQLDKVTVTETLKHPRYKMGKKISVESATLINKGLEIIEAHYLFSLPLAKIATAFHPECKIHGAVEFTKTPYEFAYIANPDMREHIENALLRAAKLPLPQRKITIMKTQKNLPPLNSKNLPGIPLVLNFFKKNPTKMKKFLHHEQKTIQKFLDGKIKFTEIFSLL